MMRNWNECNLLGLFILLSLSTNGESTKGSRLGAPCNKYECPGGHNLVCNNATKTCQCKTGYPIVVLSGVNTTFCLRAAKLEEECYDDQSCLESDENSKCLQVANKAFCGCAQDYHRILDKSTGLMKCVQEREHTNSDLTTFIGVGVGMTLFCGLTCLVLRIFARARFGPRRHHYANAHLAPPPTVVTEHGDSRRASNSSIRSTSSARSYSLKNHQTHHRPSDPEMHLMPNKLQEHSASANVSPNSRNHRSPQKDSRSSSTGAIGLNQ